MLLSRKKKKKETPRYSIFKNDPLRGGRLSPGGHGNAPGRGRSGPAAPANLGRALFESARTHVLGGPRSSQLSADEALLQTFARSVFALSGASASCPTHRGGRGPGEKLSAQVLSKSDAARTRPRGISRSTPPKVNLKLPDGARFPKQKDRTVLSAVILFSPSATAAVLSVRSGMPFNSPSPMLLGPLEYLQAAQTSKNKSTSPTRRTARTSVGGRRGDGPSGSGPEAGVLQAPARRGAGEAGLLPRRPAELGAVAELEAGPGAGGPAASPSAPAGEPAAQGRAGLREPGVEGGRPARGSRPSLGPPAPRPSASAPPPCAPPGPRRPRVHGPPASGRATFPPSPHSSGRRVPGRGAAARARAARGRAGQDSPSSSSRSRWLKIPQKLGRLLMSFLSFISCIR